jgi:hypothetical protein
MGWLGLALLGPPQVRRDGRAVTFRTRRVLALLASPRRPEMSTQSSLNSQRGSTLAHASGGGSPKSEPGSVLVDPKRLAT